VTARLGAGGGEAGEADTYSSIEGINGGSADDVLTGRKKRTDRLAGGAGADTLDGRSGKDYLLGGKGNDIVNAFDRGREWSIRCGSGSDRATVDRKKDKPRGCERVRKRGPR
jgi:Ca2+-binding RTX toxin-like protein